MKTKRNSKVAQFFCALFLITLSSKAQQVFTLNGGYKSFPAQEAGTPDFPNGNVLVRRAPSPTGNVDQIRQTLNAATIPDDVIQSRLTEGPLAGHIAQMPAVISTANALNGRPQTANVSNAIIINSTAILNNNRNRIGNNNTETYIFRGNVNVNDPIVVGSNKTFWIDGRVTYTGPERPLANTDALSPIPIIRDGIFRMVGKRNIKINGTKRGLVDCKSRLPFAYALNSREITVVGNEVINGFNSIFMHQTREVTIENNFLYNNVRRAMHIIAVNGYSIKNNLCYINHLDGIDIDAFTQNGRVDLNVVVGVNFRFMLWTEIDAHDNILDNNVAIHLEGRKARGVGGMQENGTENSRRGVGNFQGSRNNDWINNHVFYPEKFRDGIVMRRDRFIQHNTINFVNNYGWSVEGNVQRHNPKPQNNITNDVRFLTLNNPSQGNRPNPTNLYPNGGPEVLINNAPDNLTGDEIRVTPGLFGGGGGDPDPGNQNAIAIPGTIQVENFTGKSGSVRTENTPNSNGQNLGFIRNGDNARYQINVDRTGTYIVNAYVSSNGVGGTITFRANNSNAEQVTVTSNNNWHNYVKVETEVTLNAGNQELQLNFNGPNGFLYNVDRIEIERSNTPPVVRNTTLSPVDDSYLQGSTNFNSNVLRVENGRRISYLKFDLRQINGTINTASLELTVSGDPGNGSIKVYRGNSNNWTETNLNNGNRPGRGAELGSLNKNYPLNSKETFTLLNLQRSNFITLIVEMSQGNDVSFASSESSNGPQLNISYTESGSKSTTSIDKNVIQVFPNPTTDFIEVATSNGDLIIENISIYDINGTYLGELTTSGNRYNVSSLSTGIYLIKAILKNTSSNTLQTEIIKIIKK